MPELPIKTAKTLNNRSVNPPKRQTNRGSDGKHFLNQNKQAKAPVPAAVEGGSNLATAERSGECQTEHENPWPQSRDTHHEDPESKSAPLLRPKCGR